MTRVSLTYPNEMFGAFRVTGNESSSEARGKRQWRARPFSRTEEVSIRLWQRQPLGASMEALVRLQHLPRRQRIVQEAIERNRRDTRERRKNSA